MEFMIGPSFAGSPERYREFVEVNRQAQQASRSWRTESEDSGKSSRKRFGFVRRLIIRIATAVARMAEGGGVEPAEDVEIPQVAAVEQVAVADDNRRIGGMMYL